MNRVRSRLALISVLFLSGYGCKTANPKANLAQVQLADPDRIAAAVRKAEYFKQMREGAERKMSQAAADSPNTRAYVGLPDTEFRQVGTFWRTIRPSGKPVEMYMCTATWINSFMILTAGHCLDGFTGHRPENEAWDFTYDEAIAGSTKTSYLADVFTLCSSNNDCIDNDRDISLLLLDLEFAQDAMQYPRQMEFLSWSPFQSDGTYSPLSIPNLIGVEDLINGDNVVAVGTGNNGSGLNCNTDQVFTPEARRQRYDFSFGYGQRYACPGDSGGPLIKKINSISDQIVYRVISSINFGGQGWTSYGDVYKYREALKSKISEWYQTTIMPLFPSKTFLPIIIH